MAEVDVTIGDNSFLRANYNEADQASFAFISPISELSTSITQNARTTWNAV